MKKGLSPLGDAHNNSVTVHGNTLVAIVKKDGPYTFLIISARQKDDAGIKRTVIQKT